jgi:hypothetical protein
LLVGELKKGKYVYYHCTGNRGKCPEPYTRQEAFAREFANVLQELVVPPAILEWLGEAVLDSDRTEQAARAESIKKLKARCDQIEVRIETMYMDKLDGRITQEFFDKQAATLRRDREGLLRKIQDILKATPAPVDQAIDMLRLTSRASELFLDNLPVSNVGCSKLFLKKRPGRTGRCRRRYSNRSKSCATRTRKVIERKRRRWARDANLQFGSPAWIRTTNLTGF